MKKLALLVSIAAAVLGAPAANAANNVTVGHSSWFWGNPQPQGNTLNAIDFAGGTGYAAGDFGTLLKTTDNGFTWTGIATGVTVNLQQVRLLDANTLFIGAGCLRDASYRTNRRHPEPRRRLSRALPRRGSN